MSSVWKRQAKHHATNFELLERLWGCKMGRFLWCWVVYFYLCSYYLFFYVYSFHAPKGLIFLLRSFKLKPSETPDDGTARFYKWLWALFWVSWYIKCIPMPITKKYRSSSSSWGREDVKQKPTSPACCPSSSDTSTAPSKLCHYYRSNLLLLLRGYEQQALVV